MAFNADREIPGTDLTPDPLLRKGEATETRVAMNALIQHSSVARLWALVLLCAIAAQALAQNKLPARSPLHFADYDSEPRRTDGHVDGDALLARLKELHVTTYYWLVWHAATDWDDLKLFLPKAAQATCRFGSIWSRLRRVRPKMAACIPNRFGWTTGAGRRKSRASLSSIRT